jgi:CRISPR/Cas system-associated protein Cas10 (large subunit of type III CRISPR-Cas system)
MNLFKQIEQILEETVDKQDKRWNINESIDNRQDTHEKTWEDTKKRNRKWINVLKTGGTPTGPAYPEKVKTSGHISAPPMEEDNHQFTSIPSECAWCGEEFDENESGYDEFCCDDCAEQNQNAEDGIEIEEGCGKKHEQIDENYEEDGYQCVECGVEYPDDSYFTAWSDYEVDQVCHQCEEDEIEARLLDNDELEEMSAAGGAGTSIQGAPNTKRKDMQTLIREEVKQMMRNK